MSPFAQVSLLVPDTEGFTRLEEGQCVSKDDHSEPNIEQPGGDVEVAEDAAGALDGLIASLEHEDQDNSGESRVDEGQAQLGRQRRKQPVPARVGVAVGENGVAMDVDADGEGQGAGEALQVRVDGDGEHAKYIPSDQGPSHREGGLDSMELVKATDVGVAVEQGRDSEEDEESPDEGDQLQAWGELR